VGLAEEVEAEVEVAQLLVERVRRLRLVKADEGEGKKHAAAVVGRKVARKSVVRTTTTMTIWLTSLSKMTVMSKASKRWLCLYSSAVTQACQNKKNCSVMLSINQCSSNYRYFASIN